MRYIVKIYGIVQGVGFLPFVYKKAQDFKIYEYVKNIGGAVLIDCYGRRENIK
jgi:hydrogenase maturation protein HypF